MKAFSKIAILAIAGASLCVSSCKKDPAQLADRKLEELTQKVAVPQKLNDYTTLVGCYYADKVFTYRNEIPAKEMAELNLEDLKAQTLENLRNGVGPTQTLVNTVVEAGAGIRYIYVCGTDSVMFTLTGADLAPQQ